MRYLVLVFSLGLLLPFQSHSQSDSLKNILRKLGTQEKVAIDTLDQHTLNSIGRINHYADSAIVQLERHSRGFKEMRGYRIQLMMGSIDQIKTERNKYLSLGLPYAAYLKQVVPEYSLQVGDFKNKMEVERHLQILKEHYPKAFIVVDVIEPPRYSTKNK